MPTDTQLRTALTAHADAYDLDAAERQALEFVYSSVLTSDRLPRRRHRGLLMVASAAATAAIVVASVTIVTHRSTGTPPASRSAAPVPTAPATVANVQGLAAGEVDAVAITTTYPITWDLRPEMEFATVQVPGGRHATVVAYSPVVGFSAARIENARPVTVAGTQGYFGDVSDWPANGRPDPQSGKQDGALPSVVWQLGNGVWVLVQSDDPNIGSAAGLAELADSLGIRTKTAATRVPFTVGYLPEGLTLGTVTYSDGAVLADGRVSTDFTVSLKTAQGGYLDIDLGTMPLTDPVDPGAHPVVSRPAGDLTLSVLGSEPMTTATLQRVIDSIQVVPDAAAHREAWPTLPEALS